MRTAVVLPAPFGPEHAEHRAAPGGEVDPVQGLGGAEALAQALGLDHVGHAGSVCGGADIARTPG